MDFLYLATCLCSPLILTEEAGLPGRAWVYTPRSMRVGWSRGEGTAVGVCPSVSIVEDPLLLPRFMAAELGLRWRNGLKGLGRMNGIVQ